jgi:hypothetical protein
MKYHRKYEEFLSGYIDGTLSEENKRFVEETLLKNPEWRKRYEQLRVLRSKMNLLSSPEDKPSLWPELSRRIQNEGKKSAPIEFIPSKLVPALTVLIMIVVGLASFLVTRNWDTVTEYFADTRSVVEDIYERGIIRGALQPLFDGISNDDLIRFAVSGVLTIPEAEGKGLKVESESDDRFGLEFADTDPAREAPSLSELYADLNVTEDQIWSIDSVLTDYKDVIRSSAFLTDGDEIVISPELAGLDKFILMSVAEFLNPEQRISFNKVLNRFNPDIQIPEVGPLPQFVSFAVSPDQEAHIQIVPPPRPETEARERIAELPQPEKPKKPATRTFIVVNPDTVMSKEIEIPDYRHFVAQRVDAEAIQQKVGEKLAKSLQNTRIHIHPYVDVDHDERRVQIYTRIDRSDETGEIAPFTMKFDSLMMNQFSKDHFIRLHELSKIMHQHAREMQRYRPEVHGLDSLGLPPHFDPLDETFHERMRQLGFDHERLMIMRDSLLLRLFPDTLDRKE